MSFDHTVMLNSEDTGLVKVAQFKFRDDAVAYIKETQKEDKKYSYFYTPFQILTKASDATLKLVENAHAIVEANNFEKHMLWEKYHEKLKWSGSGCSGLFVHVGTTSGNPVYISLLVDTINDLKIIFWYASGTFVDYDLINKWLKENIKPVSGRYTIDANNFHHALY